MKIVEKFKSKPTIYYAMSIVASWAGVGALMNFRTLALNYGTIPAVIWGVFNTLACIVFGLAIEHIPEIREIMKTKFIFWFIGFLTIFQTWTQMSGIHEIFADTPIGANGGMIIAYVTAIIFLLILLKNGMIRNVLSDDLSWIIVYGLLLFVCIGSLIYTKGDTQQTTLGLENIKVGFSKGILLIPGPFACPYYYSLYDYNEKNVDGTGKGDIKKAFIYAGLMFGVFMFFSALLTYTKFSPFMNTVKAILVTVIAISSLSTYLYCEYIAFGKKVGFAIDVLTVAGWNFLIPLGVMGIWTLMSEIRIYVICGVVILALFKKLKKKYATSQN